MEKDLVFKYIDPNEPLHEGIQNREWIEREDFEKKFMDYENQKDYPVFVDNNIPYGLNKNINGKKNV